SFKVSGVIDGSQHMDACGMINTGRRAVGMHFVSPRRDHGGNSHRLSDPARLGEIGLEYLHGPLFQQPGKLKPRVVIFAGGDRYTLTYLGGGSIGTKVVARKWLFQ